MTGLLLILLLLCLPVLSLLEDLCCRDLDHSRAIAEAALERALEDLESGTWDTSGAGTE
jgi:hypothetical protein